MCAMKFILKMATAALPGILLGTTIPDGHSESHPRQNEKIPPEQKILYPWSNEANIAVSGVTRIQDMTIWGSES